MDYDQDNYYDQNNYYDNGLPKNEKIILKNNLSSSNNNIYKSSNIKLERICDDGAPNIRLTSICGEALMCGMNTLITLNNDKFESSAPNDDKFKASAPFNDELPPNYNDIINNELPPNYNDIINDELTKQNYNNIQGLNYLLKSNCIIS